MKVRGCLAVALLLAGCHPAKDSSIQGYVEGEYVYIASPFAGALESLHVTRGAQVQPGDLLFALDVQPEQSARDEAERHLAQARAQLDDTKKGKRAPEIASLEQQLQQARAALTLSEKTFSRQENLFRSGATAANEFDASRAARDQDQHRVSQLEADLQTAALGSRDDLIVAAEANVRAQESALALADWNLAQKRQCAPQAGLVFDTLYRRGEWVAAGRPVVSLLPPANIKVRAFVPQALVSRLHTGDTVRVTVDGLPAPLTGKVTYIAPQAEYTPPVIYSQESRGKLVFMTEIHFDDAVARTLHPGQPVDVRLPRP